MPSFFLTRIIGDEKELVLGVMILSFHILLFNPNFNIFSSKIMGILIVECLNACFLRRKKNKIKGRRNQEN